MSAQLPAAGTASSVTTLRHKDLLGISDLTPGEIQLVDDVPRAFAELVATTAPSSITVCSCSWAPANWRCWCKCTTKSSTKARETRALTGGCSSYCRTPPDSAFLSSLI